MNARAAGLLGALPDGLTAAAFLAVWASPFVFGELSVKTAMLTMLVEFFLIHGTGFFTALGNARDVKHYQRVLGMLGLSLFYLAMIGAFAWSFGEWWPLLAFAWLVVGKAAWAVTQRPATDDQMFALMAAWAGSVVAYLAGCFLTVIPETFPRWGITADLQPRFGFGADSGGLWVEEPHRVVAFGAIYFSLLCAAKLLAVGWRHRNPANPESESRL